MNNKVSLDGMLKAVLGIFNIPQNSSLPPSIYSSMYNATTSMILSHAAKIFPNSSSVLDIIDPLVERTIVPVKSGKLLFPESYRNILGSPQISAKKDGSSECGKNLITTQEFNSAVQKSGCEKRPIVEVKQTEFAYKTTSSYDAPDYYNPIGYRAGKREMVVCPADISSAEIMYIRNEKTYVYGYKMNPDDTYYFDPETSVESEFENAAFEPLFKGICACYAAWSRDRELIDWSRILNNENLF